MCCNRCCVLVGQKIYGWVTIFICDLQKVSLCLGLHECCAIGDGGHGPSLSYTNEENHKKNLSQVSQRVLGTILLYARQTACLSHFSELCSPSIMSVCVVLGCRILMHEGMSLF